MRTIVLDIETIADPAALAQVEDGGADFLPWPLHALACVSLFTVDSSPTLQWQFHIDTFSRVNLSERAILAEAENRLEKADRVRTFNGRGFDAPVLAARAAVCGLHTPTINIMHGRAKGPQFHLDLLDEVSSYHSAPKFKLAHLCAAFGIPVKLEAAGEDVASLAVTGEWERIGRYCETDVVATWLATEAWRAAEDAERHDLARGAVAQWIMSDQPRLMHLLPYAAPAALGGGPALRVDPALPRF